MPPLNPQTVPDQYAANPKSNQPSSEPVGEEDPWWSTALKVVGVVGGTIGIAALGYRDLRGLFDEDFGGRTYPAWYREQLRDEAATSNAYWCPRCNRKVNRSDLTVDHKFPWSKGGATSRWNASLICGPCNSSKGNRTDILDNLFLS